MACRVSLRGGKRPSLKSDDLDAPIDLFFLFRLAQKERTKEKGEAS
jgi:hypothetical protein